MMSEISLKQFFEYESIYLKSDFQKRQIYYDLNKCSLDMLQDKVSHYLIIDLVDERFPLVKYCGI